MIKIALFMILSVPLRAQQSTLPEEIRDEAISENFDYLSSRVNQAITNKTFPNGICFDSAQTDCQTTAASVTSTTSTVVNSVSTTSYSGDQNITISTYSGTGIAGSTLTLTNVTAGNKLEYCFNFLARSNTASNLYAQCTVLFDGLPRRANADVSAIILSSSYIAGVSACVVSNPVTAGSHTASLTCWHDYTSGATITILGASYAWSASMKEIH